MAAVEMRGGDRAFAMWVTALSLAGVLPQYLVSSLVVGMREDFPIRDAELGVALAVSFAISALVALNAWRLIDWIGMRRALTLAGGLVGAGALGMAVLADSAAAVIALMTLNGLGGGLGGPAFATLLAASVPLERRGSALGLLTSAPQMATLSAGLALPLIAVPFSWRAAFAISAAMSAVALAAVLRSGRAAGAAPRPEAPARIRGLGSIHLISVAVALASAAVMGLRSFLVVFAVSEGFSATAAGLLMAACGAMALGSRLVLGVLGDRRPGDGLRRAAAIMALSALGFVLLIAGGSLPVVLGALLAGGLGWSWHAPLSLAVVSRYPYTTGAAMGMQMSGFFAGALTGPLLVGLMAERGSYTAAWAISGGLALTAGAVALSARGLRSELA